MNFLIDKPIEQMSYFLNKVSNISSVDVNDIKIIADKTIKYLKGNSDFRQSTEEAQTLQLQWYASLDIDKPDFSVYETDYYLAELWACWIVYSRQALRNIVSKGIAHDLEGVKRVIDLGCGIGFSTAALKQIFPRADVFGTNIGDTTQMKVARSMAQEFDFAVVSNLKDIPADDSKTLVLASEYFEHFQSPIAHLDEILTLRPTTMLIANAFGTKAIGHFETYRIDGAIVAGEHASLIFNKTLRDRGFTKIKTKLWNNRPALWQKQNLTLGTIGDLW